MTAVINSPEPYTGLYASLPAWEMPPWVADTGWYRSRVLYSLARSGADIIRRVEDDGIPQVAPICVAMRMLPAGCRAKLGKGLWKQFHHSQAVHNAYRAKAFLQFNMSFQDLIHVPTGFLRELNGALKLSPIQALDHIRVASRIASNRDEMRQAIWLVRDTVRMRGRVDPAWSMRRLREEHDRLAWEAAKSRASPDEWARPWSCELNGYTFTRLVSNLAFAEEGAVMRHCVAAYARDAKAGAEITFRIEGPERATVSFGSGRSVEIKGPRNIAVKEETLRAAIKAYAMWTADQKVVLP